MTSIHSPEARPGLEPRLGAPTIVREKQLDPTDVRAREPGSRRLEYLDALKVVLIVLVVAHHAGQAYGPTGGTWLVSNPDKAPILGRFFSVNASFFMGLFFLISAYFLPASFERKGPVRFLKERFVRLGTPLAIAVLLVLLIGFVLYLLNGGAPTSGFGAILDMWFGHLWFLEHLLVYAMLYTGWRLLTARRSIGVPPLPGNAAILIFTVVLALVTFVVRIDFPIDRWVNLFGLIGAELAHLPQYASLFVIGLLAYQGRWLNRMPTRTGMLWLGIGTVAAALRYIHPIGSGGGFSLDSLIWSTWEAFIATGLCVGLLVLFREYVATPNRLLRMAAPNAFGVYIIQQPVMIVLQLGLLALAAPALLKWSLVVLIGVPLCFGLSALLRRLPGARAVL